MSVVPLRKLGVLHRYYLPPYDAVIGEHSANYRPFWQQIEFVVVRAWNPRSSTTGSRTVTE